MRKIAFILIILLTSGCSTLRTMWPGGVTVNDIEFDGIKTGQPISIIATLDSRATAGALLLEALGQSDPLGSLLPVTLLNETSPRWILCAGEFAAKCKLIPLMAKVHFAGKPVGPGLLWQPVRLTADNFND